MNYFFRVLLAMLLIGSSLGQASNDENSIAKSELQADNQTYSPGMGEIMAGIQLRHAKLWYSGIGGNWKLAEYELDEILEGLDDVKKYQPNFEGKPIAEMIGPITSESIKNLEQAIKVKNKGLFVKSFDGLSHACNACHATNGFGFIHIQRPVTPPLTNQRYK